MNDFGYLFTFGWLGTMTNVWDQSCLRESVNNSVAQGVVIRAEIAINKISRIDLQKMG